MNKSENQAQQDVAHQLEEAAGKIANKLVEGFTVKYGPLRHEFYDMKDVQEYLLLNDEFCARFDKIHLEWMYAVQDADKAVAPNISMDELTMDAIGSFAQSKSEQVINYWMQENQS